MAEVKNWLPARFLVPGPVEGPVVALSEPVSFWGGIDPVTGVVVDRRHPEAGVSVTGGVLVVPYGRGSSSASSVLAEMIRAGTAPAALVLRTADPILVLGAVVADELYGGVTPIAVVEREGHGAAARAPWLVLDPDRGLVGIGMTGPEIGASCR